MQAAFASTSQRKSYGLIDALRPTGFSNVFPVWIEFACVDQIEKHWWSEIHVVVVNNNNRIYHFFC